MSGERRVQGGLVFRSRRNRKTRLTGGHLFPRLLYLDTTRRRRSAPPMFAAYASRQNADDDLKHDLAVDFGHRAVTRHQYYSELKVRGLTKMEFL